MSSDMIALTKISLFTSSNLFMQTIMSSRYNTQLYAISLKTYNLVKGLSNIIIDQPQFKSSQVPFLAV